MPNHKKEPFVRCMLDSGAFSAWSRNEELNLKDYISFVKKNSTILESYVSMDVIPGKFGRRRSTDDISASAKKSYENLQRMKDAGLNPIPVFHAGENFTWLDKMLADGETYIGISASKDAPRGEQRKWLDQCFTILTGSKGQPLIHTHGFGITLFEFLTRYPWTTSDSTTWSLNAGYGHVYIPPMGRDGKPDFKSQPLAIVMSENRDRQTGLDKHFDGAFGKIVLNYITTYLGGLGIGLSEIRYSSDARRKASAIYFMQFVKHLGEVTFKYRVPSLTSARIAQKAIKNNRFVIKLATIARNGAFARLLQEIGARDQLLSYYELRKMKQAELEEFMATGLKKGYTPNIVKADWEKDPYLTKRRFDLLRRINAGRSDTEEAPF